MCVMNDVMYVCCAFVCFALGSVARLSQQRNPNTTLQLTYLPPSQRKTSRKKIFNKHQAHCV
jgi:hypothetical protein